MNPAGLRTTIVDGVVYVAAEDIETQTLAAAERWRADYAHAGAGTRMAGRCQAAADANDAIRKVIARARQKATS